MSATFLHDGVLFDLTLPHVDVTGVEWVWTGSWDTDGAPLLSELHSTQPVPWPDVYRDHGPLIPVSPRPTAAQCLAAVDVDYTRSRSAGYVESPLWPTRNHKGNK